MLSERYYENMEHSENVTGAPIFIMLEGALPDESHFLLVAGQMYQIARTHQAVMYLTEHRYYGKSRPVK